MTKDSINDSLITVCSILYEEGPMTLPIFHAIDPPQTRRAENAVRLYTEGNERIVFEYAVLHHSEKEGFDLGRQSSRYCLVMSVSLTLKKGIWVLSKPEYSLKICDAIQYTVYEYPDGMSFVRSYADLFEAQYSLMEDFIRLLDQDLKISGFFNSKAGYLNAVLFALTVDLLCEEDPNLRLKFRFKKLPTGEKVYPIGAPLRNGSSRANQVALIEALRLGFEA